MVSGKGTDRIFKKVVAFGIELNPLSAIDALSFVCGGVESENTLDDENVDRTAGQ